MPEDFQLFITLRKDDILLDVPDKGPAHAGWNTANRSPIYMLDFHRDRMLNAAMHWGWTAAVHALQGNSGVQRLTDLIGAEAAASGQTGPLRVKVLLSEKGHLACEVSPIPQLSLQNLFPVRLPPPGCQRLSEGDPAKESAFEVTIDSVPTEHSEFTHYKTTRRAMYDGARSRAGIQLTDKKEVCLVNEADGQVMEGSLTTPYFWRDGRWVTPPIPAAYKPGAGSGGQSGTTRRWALERHIAVEEAVPASTIEEGEECWMSNGARGFFFGRVTKVPK